MPTVKIEQSELFYAETGKNAEGSPLILIHGAGSNHLCWPAEVRRLENRRVLGLDLPGHMRSTGEGKKEVIAYARVVLAVMDSLKIEKAIFMGHSMGGAISQTLALTAPERTAGIILVGTGAKLRVHERILKGILENKAATVRLINQWSWGEGADEKIKSLTAEQMMEVPSTVTHGDFLACNNYNRMDEVSNIRVPALVIGGADDKMTPFKYSEYLADKISNSTLVKIEGAGHMMALEYPEQIATAMKEWLTNQKL